VKQHCRTIAASQQARHRVLRRAAARLPASIADLLSSSDNQQTPNVDCFGAPYDDIRAPTTNKAPLYDDIRRPMIVGRRMSSALALRTTAFGVRQSSKRLRWLSEPGRNRSRHPAFREIRTSMCSRLSESARHRTRMLLRCVEARVQCPVQRAQCCPAKHPDGYIEALF
jgi:hypothetical protein